MKINLCEQLKLQAKSTDW